MTARTPTKAANILRGRERLRDIFSSNGGWVPPGSTSEARGSCASGGRISGQPVVEHALEAGRVGVDRHRLVQAHLDLAPVDREPGDLVVEPGPVTDHAPLHRRVFDAGAVGEGPPYDLEGAGHPRSDHAPLLLLEGIAVRRADRLPDVRLDPRAAGEGDLEQVGVVDVAGQDDDRGRRAAALAGADRADDLGQPRERLAEGRPVLEVYRSPQA